MKVYSQLEKAQLENVAADPVLGVTGRVALNTTSKEAVYDDSDAIRTVANLEKAQTFTGVKTHDTQIVAKEIATPATPPSGYSALYPKADGFWYYQNDAGSESSIAGGAVTPVGMITAWLGGYFTNGSNGTYTDVLAGANTVAGANSYLNSLGYYVCDGAALNDPASPIFNAAGRYLPKLTDDRFINGGTTGGGVGGANTLTDHTHTHSLTQAHTHGATTATESVGHTHATYYASSAGMAAGSYRFSLANASGSDGNQSGQFSQNVNHTHTVTTSSQSSTTVSGTIGTGSAATSTENRPKYLSCFYIIKVK